MTMMTEGNPEQPVIIKVLTMVQQSPGPMPLPTAVIAAMTPTPLATLSRREFVADDAERQRQDAAANALDRSGDDQDGDRVGEARDERAGGERHEGRPRACVPCPSCRQCVPRSV